MNKKYCFIICVSFFLCGTSLFSMDMAFGFDQWNRIEKTENTAIMAPGAELFFCVYPYENIELSLGLMGGRYFGTVLGGSLQGNYYFELNNDTAWQPGLGMGLAGGYIDQIFMTTTSYDYIVPYNWGVGLQLNVIPLNFETNWGYFSIAEVSLGTDFSAFLRKNHLDLRLLKFTIKF